MARGKQASKAKPKKAVKPAKRAAPAKSKAKQPKPKAKQPKPKAKAAKPKRKQAATQPARKVVPTLLGVGTTPRKPKKRPVEPRDDVEKQRRIEAAVDDADFIAETPTEAKRILTARERVMRSSPVVEILEDDYPLGALRRFLDSI